MILQLYQRYIICDIIKSFSLIIFIITGISWISQILKLLYLIDKGIGFIDFLYLVTLILPALLFVTLPFITVIAVIYSYHHLNEERQLIALRNIGLNNLALAKPALLFAAFVSIVSCYLSVELIPSSYIKLKSKLNIMRHYYVSNMINEKTFHHIAKSVTIYVNHKQADGTIQGVVLFDSRQHESNPAILFASYGKLDIVDNGLVLYLKHGMQQTYDSLNHIIRLAFDSVKLEFNSSVKESNIQRHDVNEHYITELLFPDKSLSQARQVKLQAEGHQRLLWPLYNLIFTFVGISIFLKYPYSKKSSACPLIMTMSIIVIFTLLHFTFQNIAARHVHNLSMIYLNCIMFIVYAVYLYLGQELRV